MNDLSTVVTDKLQQAAYDFLSRGSYRVRSGALRSAEPDAGYISPQYNKTGHSGT
jgi:hypothetical protein